MTQLLSLHYRNATNRRIANYQVTYGVPLPAGVLSETTDLGIALPDGEIRPVQSQVLETWANGSVKWLLLDFSLPLAANEQGTVALVHGADIHEQHSLSLQETPDAITVTTNTLSACFSKTAFSLFESYIADGKEMMAAESDIVVEDLDGKRYYASLAKALDVRVIIQGSQRIVVQVTGRHTAEDGAELLTFRVRYTFRPDDAGVAIAYKFTNREEPAMGVMLATIQVVLPTRLGRTTTKYIRQTNHGEDWYSRQLEIHENVEVLNGLTLVDPNSSARPGRPQSVLQGKVLIRNLGSLREDLSSYPYYLLPGNPRTDTSGGLRNIYPYLGVNGDEASLVAWFYDMEHNFPKGLRCDRRVMTFDIWPAFAGPLQVRRGQSKEHDLFVSFAGRRREPAEMEGVYFDHEYLSFSAFGADPPLQLTLEAGYVRSCRVLELHRWLAYDNRRYSAVEVKLAGLGVFAMPAGKGMFDLGDYISPDRSWARNNENDLILDDLREYYRRREPNLLRKAIMQARHNAHVDFIAYDPNPLRQGTMPAHCPEHTDGATYPSHMWVDGLLAAYTVTGEPDYLEAAVSVGENMLRWQANAPISFYADSRECGWPMLAFLRLHEYSREQKWLDACEAVFQFYLRSLDHDGQIRYELPHGVGTFVSGYCDFIAWRALFFYWERTGRDDVKALLLRCLQKVYLIEPGTREAGWGGNDLFPAWAAYTLTGDDKYIADNYPFFRYLMDRPGDFPLGGMDVHYYLAELDRRGALQGFCTAHDTETPPPAP